MRRAVHDVGADLPEDRDGTLECGNPAPKSRCVRVRRLRPPVATVPMHAAAIGHIEADQYDPAGTPLNHQVECLKPAVAAATHGIGIENDPSRELLAVLARRDLDLADVWIVEPGAFPRSLQTLEFRQTAPKSPPCRIAAVDRISPRAEIDVLLDRNYAD